MVPFLNWAARGFILQLSALWESVTVASAPFRYPVVAAFAKRTAIATSPVPTYLTSFMAARPDSMAGHHSLDLLARHIRRPSLGQFQELLDASSRSKLSLFL